MTDAEIYVVSRFYFHVQTNLHLNNSETAFDKSTPCLYCHQQNYSPSQMIIQEKKRKKNKKTLLLDEDGDHILQRKNTHTKLLDPDLQITSFTTEPCDANVLQRGYSLSSQLQTVYNISEVSPFQDYDLSIITKCDSGQIRIQEYKDLAQGCNVNFSKEVTPATSMEKTKRDINSDNKYLISIEHKMETILPEVGFQVWSGALLLCDYLIHNSTELEDKHVLDLGSGTGITSIVAAMFARCVVCSDYSVDLMELAERNWLRNKDYLPHRHCCEIYFKVLDWTCNYPAVKEKSSCTKYHIMEEDLNLIEEATIIIAAEVVYDEELTQAFFKTIYNLLSHSPPKSLLVALEKRVVFSSEIHQICSPAYEDFCDNVADLTSIDEGPIHFSAFKIRKDFPEYFHYERHKNLELWKISSVSTM